jgi:DNA-binding HxlR family transcriptional regulator
MRDATGQEPIGGGEWSPAFDPRDVVSHPHVVEILDALRHGPMSLADLRSSVRAGRRGLASALRVVAAHGLVVKNDTGSWDGVASDDAVYRQTDHGRRLAEQLTSFSVWTSMLERAPGSAIDSSAPDRGTSDAES